jgi:hypothetical protein
MEVDGVVVNHLPENTVDRIYPTTEYHDAMPKLDKTAQDLSEDAYNNPRSGQAPGIRPAKVVPGKPLVSRLTPAIKIPDVNEFAVHSTKRQTTDKLVTQIAKNPSPPVALKQQSKPKPPAVPKNDVIHVERKTVRTPETLPPNTKIDKSKSQPIITKQPEVTQPKAVVKSKTPIAKLTPVEAHKTKPSPAIQAETIPHAVEPGKAQNDAAPRDVALQVEIKPTSKRAQKRQNKVLKPKIVAMHPIIQSIGEKPPYTDDNYHDDIEDWMPPRATKYVPKIKSCTPDATGDGRLPQ